MHREWVDRTAHQGGPLQGWDPRLKVGLALTTLLVISFGARSAGTESWLRLGTLLAASIALAGWAGVPRWKWFGRSLVILPFVGLVALSALVEVVPDGEVGVSIGGWSIVAAEGGGERALRILCRAWLSILVALLLVLTTPLPAILGALRSWHLPRGFLHVCALVYRYLWVLVEEARRLLLARRLRGGARAARWRSSGRIIAHLFARSLERAHRIELAFRLRGASGSLHFGPELRWGGPDWRRLLLASGVLLVVLWAPRWLASGGGGIG